MPKTAHKRAEARREARIVRAHQQAPQHPVSRRVPAARGRKRQSGLAGILQRYPWGSSLFLILVIGMSLLVMRQQHLGPFALPAGPGKPAQAVCSLKTHTCNKAPLMTISTAKAYSATIETSKGAITVQLDPKTAPIAVNDFVFLADQHFYDGLTFSRVERLNQISPITNQPSNLQLIQGGAGGVQGGPGYTLKFDAVTGSYSAGTIAMANASQFFISTGDNSQAITTKTFPIFGVVTSGLNVAQQINQGDMILSVTITVSNPAPTPTAAATASPTP